MADDKDDSSPLAKLSSNGLLWLLLAAFGAAVLQRAPLLVEHPPSPGDTRVAVTADVAREARLWQDPFDIAPSPSAPSDLKVGDLPPGAPLDLQQTLATHPPDALILVTSLPGGIYAEAMERRRRMRVAVVEGLMAEGLVAENAQQLHLAGSIPYEWFVPAARIDPASADSAPARGPSAVLVLWVAESSLGATPRAALCTALGNATGSTPANARAMSAHTATSTPDAPGTAPHVVVLGPGDSQSLVTMLNEPPDSCSERQAKVKDDEAKKAPPLPHFFTSMATIAIPPRQVAGAPARNAAQVPGANTGLGASGITRTIADDEQVARALVDELSLRSVNPFQSDEVAWTAREILRGHRDASDDAVALVTEADTPYGRAMPGAFCRGFRKADSAHRPPGWPCENDPDSHQGLYLFSYLRGLNGEVHRADRSAGHGPGTAGAGRSAANPAASSAGAASGSAGGDSGSADGGHPSTASNVERAEGNAQTDYLERLADRLSDLDQQLRSDHDNPRVLRAIGLLGTDVYDKLMLLRALKPRFPGVVFFSTDLDARLLDGSELPFTRNLVIGSSFGLRLADTESASATALPPLSQQGFPDFRDSYQTATFLTTRVALRVPDGRFSDAQKACLRHWTRHIHLYEIGRDSLNELLPRGGHLQDPDEQACTTAGWSDPQPEVEPASPPLSDRQRAGLTLTFLALLFTFLQWANPSTRAWLEQQVAGQALGEAATRLWRCFGFAAAGSLLAAALVAFAWPWMANLLTAGGEGQPLMLVSGVSVWPALLLVAVASMYWASVLVRTSGRLSDNARDIHDWLGFPEKYDELIRDLKIRAAAEPRRQRWARHMFPPSLLPPLPPAKVPPFWRGYLRGGLPSARMHRWLVLGGMMLVVFWILNDPLGNHLPLRGRYVEFSYTGLNNIALGVLMFLMVAVADASLFCTDFLDHLASANAEWPPEVLRKMESERGMRHVVALPWLRVELAARRSAAITPMIYHPFVFMAVLIVSHSSLFSPWKISLQQSVVVAATALAMLFCALKLRSSAEAVRDDCLEDLGAELQRLQSLGPGHKGECEQVRGLLRAVAADRRGALAPFSEQPLIRSLILPLLSLAGTSAAELATFWQ